MYIQQYTMKKDTTLLIRLEKKQHNEYKKLCKKHGLNMSQRFRNFIDNEIVILRTKPWVND